MRMSGTPGVGSYGWCVCVVHPMRKNGRFGSRSMKSIIPSTMQRSSTPHDEIERRAGQLMVVAQIAEAARLEKRAPASPLQIAWRDKRGAVAAIAEHRGERRSRQLRVLFGDVAEPELRIRGHEHRDERIRAASDVRVEVVEHERLRRLFLERWRRFVRTAVQRRPSRRNRLEDDQDDIGRPARAASAGRWS